MKRKVVSSKDVCPEHGSMACPICGSVLVKIEYSGRKPHLLALMKHADFRCFVGCIHVDLHDKVVNGVDYRGKVFFRPLFRKAKGAKRPEQRFRRLIDTEKKRVMRANDF